MPKTVNVKGLEQPLQFPDEMDDESILQVLRQKFSRYAEPALTIASGAIAEPISGLAGLAGTFNPFALARGGSVNPEFGAKTVESVQGALTIDPLTREGEQGLSDFGKAIMGLPVIGPALETFEEAQVAAGDKGFEEGGPLLGALAKGAVGVLPDVLGLKYLKTAKNLSQADLGTTRMFGGIGAKSADKPALAKAKQLAESGANRDEIWKETGWYDDAGDWKFEIDDSATVYKNPFSQGHRKDFGKYTEAKSSVDSIRSEMGALKEKGEFNVRDFWDSKPEGSYEAHSDNRKFLRSFEAAADPQIAKRGVVSDFIEGNISPSEYGFEDMPLRLDPKGQGASFMKYDNVSGYEGLIEVKDAAYSKGARSSALHELQHAIQGKEGFQRGGNPGAFEADYNTNIHNKEYLEGVRTDKILEARRNPEYVSLQKDIDKALDANDMKAARPLLEKRRNMEGQTVKNINAELNVLYEKTKLTPFEKYQRLAGEAEARNVQTRLDWTPEQRRNTPPWETLDVPEDELIRRSN